MLTAPSRSTFARSSSTIASASTDCASGPLAAGGLARVVRTDGIVIDDRLLRLGSRGDGLVIAGCIGPRRPRPDERPVGLEGAIRFERVHLPPEVFQADLQRRHARLGQMRQIGVGGGQGHLLPANLRAGALEGLTGSAHLLVAGCDPLPQVRHLLVHLRDLPPEGIERLDVGVELPFGAGHLLQNAASVGAGARVVGFAPGNPLAQLVGLVLEPPHVGRQRGGALGHGRMPRS